jgi:ribosomal protein S27AE
MRVTSEKIINGHTITRLTVKCPKCGKSLYQFDNVWIYCERCNYLERFDDK